MDEYLLEDWLPERLACFRICTRVGKRRQNRFAMMQADTESPDSALRNSTIKSLEIYLESFLRICDEATTSDMPKLEHLEKRCCTHQFRCDRAAHTHSLSVHL
jgi:hypothetical protein